jgi:hypothetical protein
MTSVLGSKVANARLEELVALDVASWLNLFVTHA